MEQFLTNECFAYTLNATDAGRWLQFQTLDNINVFFDNQDPPKIPSVLTPQTVDIYQMGKNEQFDDAFSE